jgi:hypothetical protein
MPILESRVDRQGMGRILLTTGLGAVLGFQSCRFLAYGLGVSVPWYGLAWILLSTDVRNYGDVFRSGCRSQSCGGDLG